MSVDAYVESDGRKLILIGGGVGEVEGGAVEGWELGEHEGAILGLFLVVVEVVVGGAEVDAGATLQRHEESRRHARPHPIRHPIQLVARHEPAIAHHRLISRHSSFLSLDFSICGFERLDYLGGNHDV